MNRKKRKRSKKEQSFEWRVQKLFEKARFVCLNISRSKPFDLVACRDGLTFFIEVKAKDTRFPEEQRRMQMDLAMKTGVNYLVVRQARKRGKVHVDFMLDSELFDDAWKVIKEVFGKYLD